MNERNIRKSGQWYYLTCCSDCNNIIGENGTKYTDKHTSVEYARVDTIQNPGYLTYKNKVI